MAEMTTLSGVLVGFERRPYAAFRGRDGDEIPGGTTLWVYLAPDDGMDAPKPIKCDAGSFDFLARGGFGGHATMAVSLDADRDRLVRKLMRVEQLADADGAAVAA
jgi:hypothetical protein